MDLNCSIAGHVHCAVPSSEVDEEKRRELMLRGAPEHCCQSFLWEQSVRDNVTENKISEQVAYFFSTRHVELHVQQEFLGLGL